MVKNKDGVRKVLYSYRDSMNEDTPLEGQTKIILFL